MGNQPSQPIPPSAAPLAPPPLPPVCDADCQRQKLLSGLKTTLDQKTGTKDQDPEGYEQARIAYFTALNGQGWLATEKSRIAKEEISPKITGYTNQYNQLTGQEQSQKVFVNLMNSLKAQEVEDEDDLHSLKKQLTQEKDKVSVLNRLSSLSTPSQPSTNYLPTVFEVLISLLGLAVLFMLYKKIDVIKRYFGYSQPAAMMGGKRVPH